MLVDKSLTTRKPLTTWHNTWYWEMFH